MTEKAILSHKRKEGNYKDRTRQGVISGKQSNHGDFMLPASVAHLAQPALYLAVAYWALALGRGVGREDIAQAFRITVHRAADVMSYILNDRQDVVSCSRQLLNGGRGQRQLLLRVTGVTEPAPTVRTPPRKKTAVPRQDIASLRTWFLTRPNPLSGR